MRASGNRFVYRRCGDFRNGDQRMMWEEMTDNERLEAVSNCIERGLSSSHIARIFGTTRGTIVGFCRRRNISLAKLRVKKLMEYSTDYPAPDVEPVPYIEAINRGLCKWPLWETFESPYVSLCCGGNRVHGRPYCEYHETIHEGTGTPSERAAVKVLEEAAAE